MLVALGSAGARFVRSRGGEPRGPGVTNYPQVFFEVLLPRFYALVLCSARTSGKPWLLPLQKKEVALVTAYYSKWIGKRMNIIVTIICA